MTSRCLLVLGTTAIAIGLAAPATASAEATHGEPPMVAQHEKLPPPQTEIVPHSAGADYPYPDAPYAESPAAHDDYSVDPDAPSWRDEYPPRPMAFDRSTWLEWCRARYRSHAHSDGATGGGILGAAVGGVIGNRVADGDRLVGTLVGAGVGGLAGYAIGSASEADDAQDYCEAWLERHLVGGYGHAYPYDGYPAAAYYHGSAYFPAQAYYPTPVMYVQVMVPVERRTVVREYVEYIDEPVTVDSDVEVEEVVRERVIEPEAATKPVPIKRSQVKAQPTKVD